MVSYLVLAMDVSPVQPGSKCGSDFSIERLLSDDSREREERTGTPSWLCCTRYQPPRIPRPVSSTSCRARRSGRHARVPFTAAQAAALEAAYTRAPYLAPPALRALASALQLRDDRIKIWFQNRRARERREKCAVVPPPRAVTLPPTRNLPPVSNSWMSHRFTNSVVLNCSRTDLPADVASPSPSLPFTELYKGHCSASEESEVDTGTDRPDTPLDVETVEDK